MTDNISKQELKQEELKKNNRGTSIQRASHRSNFFVCERKAMQNKELSLQAKGLLGVLLSFSDNFVIYKDALSQFSKNGRDGTRAAFDELIKANYIYLHNYLDERNLKRGKYYLFETPYDKNSEEFKSISRDAEKPRAAKPTLDNTYIDIDNTNKKEVASSDAQFLSKYLFTKLKEKNPKHKEPNLKQWDKEIELILRIDKRTKDEITSVLDWAFSQTDDFWPTAIQSPKTLRKLFDSAYLKKNHALQKTVIFQEIKSKNVRWVKDKIDTLTRIGARGNLSFNENEVFDSVLGVRTSLTSAKMIDIVKEWDKMRFRR